MNQNENENETGLLFAGTRTKPKPQYQLLYGTELHLKSDNRTLTSHYSVRSDMRTKPEAVAADDDIAWRQRSHRPDHVATQSWYSTGMIKSAPLDNELGVNREKMYEKHLT